MDAFLAAAVSAITALLVSFSSIFMTDRQRRRSEREAERTILNARYLNPLRLELAENHFRLAGTLRRAAAEGGRNAAMDSVTEPKEVSEKDAAWFSGAGQSPFMLFVYDVRPERAERIPAVRHVDGTARIQTINREQHPLYYELLRAFQARTGVPVLINTSFNTRSEPVVCSPRDAIECFWTSPLDALVIGPFLLEKRSLSASAPGDSVRATAALEAQRHG